MLSSTPEEWIAVVGRKLMTKSLILRTKYAYRRRNRVTVFEVPAPVYGEHLALYRKQYGEILDFSSDRKNGEWRFDIMLNKQAFTSDPICLDVGDDHSDRSKADVGSTARLATWLLPLAFRSCLPKTICMALRFPRRPQRACQRPELVC